MTARYARPVVLGAVFSILLTFAAPGQASPIPIDAAGLQDVENLKNIGLALHNYHSAFGHFPTDYSSGLSWRVALLPYLEQGALFNQFDLTKPWNDPANLPLLSQMPAVYRSPASAAGSTQADYVGGSGPDTMFPGTPLRISNVTDGTSNTLFVGEAIGTSIPWTMPGDVPIGACPTLGGSGFSSFVTGGVPFAFVDGNVRFVLDDIDCGALRGLFDPTGGVNGVNGAPDDLSKVVDYVVVVTPEPATATLLGCGLALMAARRRHRTRRTVSDAGSGRTTGHP